MEKKSYKTYEEAMNANKDISAFNLTAHGSADRSVEFAVEEQVPRVFNETELCDSMLKEHIEPIKNVCLEKNIPFIFMMVPEITEDGDRQLCVGYLPGPRTTPSLREMHKIASAKGHITPVEMRIQEEKIKLAQRIEEQLLEAGLDPDTVKKTVRATAVADMMAATAKHFGTEMVEEIEKLLKDDELRQELAKLSENISAHQDFLSEQK